MPAGAVVLARDADVEALAVGPETAGVWVVLGEGEMPPGFQPFLVLSADAGDALIDRALAAAAVCAATLGRVRELAAEAEEARNRQLELARVGIALTAERDLDRLLTLILSTSRQLVGADAGSLYLIEDDIEGKRLRFVLAQNDSLPAAGGYIASSVALDATSLAGHAAVTGEAVAIADAHQLPVGAPYRFNPNFDLAHGYVTRSLLAAPLATRTGEVIGVLELINRKRAAGPPLLDAAGADGLVVPFGSGDIEMIRALAAQAAVAIENTRLVREIEGLFEGFVRASVRAIEQRDPSTRGHSVRVAATSVALARAVESNPPQSYRGLRFTREDLTQFRYAGLLHDFGKVGVREAVLTKGNKLFPERLALVEERFRHARRAVEAQAWKRLAKALASPGHPAGDAEFEAVESEIARANAELDELFANILLANEPAVLSAPTANLLARSRSATFPAPDGHALSLLEPDELRVLAVERGSLSESERREIESHVEHSYQFLLTIPWPKRYARVPTIAYGHHEKLDGSGYPHHLPGVEIAPEVRMMTVCDIFDALAAGDRPYKHAMPAERALAVVEEEARAGRLDSELVGVFIAARIFEVGEGSQESL